MRKYLIILAMSLCSLSVFAQTGKKIPASEPVADSVLIIKGKHHNEIEQFKQNERNEIEQHRQHMKILRDALRVQQESLVNDITQAKAQGAITPEQRDAFMQRRASIHQQAEELNAENESFRNSIDQQRLAFKQHLKSEDAEH
jgi:hypothetical protein